MSSRAAALCTFLLALPVLFGCDDEPTVIQPEDRIVEVTVDAGEYLRNRFFRLDLPPAIWDDIRPPALCDSLTWTSDAPGRNLPAEIIDVTSIRIFRQLPTGQAEPGAVANIAAYVDTTGRWTDDVYDVVHGLVYGVLWEEITGWVPLLDPMTGDIQAVDLGFAAGDGEVLAVTYEFVDNGGVRTRVGDWSEDGSTRIDLDTGEPDPENGYLRLKLLMNTWQDDDPRTFRYCLRTVYSLGPAVPGQRPEYLRLESKDPNDLTPHLYTIGEQEPSLQIDWLQIFGLDRMNLEGALEPDGLADFHDSRLFDLERGLLRFPESLAHPFAGSLEQYLRHLDPTAAAAVGESWWNDVDDPLRSHLRCELYSHETIPNQIVQYSAWRFVIGYEVREE